MTSQNGGFYISAVRRPARRVKSPITMGLTLALKHKCKAFKHSSSLKYIHSDTHTHTHTPKNELLTLNSFVINYNQCLSRQC